MFLSVCLFLLCATASLAQSACVANNVAFGTFDTGAQRTFGCNVPIGSSHDIVINNPQGRRLFLYFTFGSFCSMSVTDTNFRSFGGPVSPGTGTTANTIRIEDAPCGSFVGTPYTAPCCVVVACSLANAGPGPPFGNGGCQGLSRTHIWYTQLSPVFRGGCTTSNAPLALASTGAVNTVQCSFTGAPRTQALSIVRQSLSQRSLSTSD